MINRIRRRMTAETDGYDPSSVRLRSLSIELFMLGVEHWDGYQREVHASHHAVAATRLDEQGGQACMGRRQSTPRQFVEQRTIWRGARPITFRSLAQGRRATYARPSF